MLVYRLIFALTIIQRDAKSRGVEWDGKIFRLIHWLSSWGTQGIADDEVRSRLQSHAAGDDVMNKLAMAALAQAK